MRTHVARAATGPEPTATLDEACRGRLGGGNFALVFTSPGGALDPDVLRVVIPREAGPGIGQIYSFVPPGFQERWKRGMIFDTALADIIDLSSARWIGLVNQPASGENTSESEQAETTLRVIDRQHGTVACAGRVTVRARETQCMGPTIPESCAATPETTEGMAWAALTRALASR